MQVISARLSRDEATLYRRFPRPVGASLGSLVRFVLEETPAPDPQTYAQTYRRPLLYTDASTVRVSLRLSYDDADKLRALGMGNLNDGLRVVLRTAKERL